MKKLVNALARCLFVAGSVSVIATPALSSQITSYTYNAQGLISQEDGPRTDVSDVTSYTYTATGQLLQTTNALGHQITVTAFNTAVWYNMLDDFVENYRHEHEDEHEDAHEVKDSF